MKTESSKYVGTVFDTKELFERVVEILLSELLNVLVTSTNFCYQENISVGRTNDSPAKVIYIASNLTISY